MRLKNESRDELKMPPLNISPCTKSVVYSRREEKKHAIKCGMGSNEMQSYRDSARNRQYTRQYKGECVITRLKD